MLIAPAVLIRPIEYGCALLVGDLPLNHTPSGPAVIPRMGTPTPHETGAGYVVDEGGFVPRPRRAIEGGTGGVAPLLPQLVNQSESSPCGPAVIPRGDAIPQPLAHELFV